MKNKLLIIILSLLFVFGVVGTFWGPNIVEAATVWNSCPKGLVNDPYPGQCHSYIDTNGDTTFDLTIATLNTTDVITVGQDILVGS